ncbi:Six-hairpin glycosidase-like protein [Radiomyces spectabilis]|uniref:Six-hairpin glycosidase-like protein n=1 Tax=Radiomyces spectabilis TaxID=64574 RepID=UPI0022201B77|nr:Six-hairpin glycosidase-like protein [Radiomyces spectabilis]KAI8381076.1 Six-hairpin glycosidase-like protein [Radiomyces spectabilis]
MAKSPPPEYVRLLEHSLLFYEAQRSGRLPTDQRVTWRHDSALSDGSDVKLDLTGGYYDAGDYIKSTYPLCYTLFTLSWGGIEYMEGYKKANQLNSLRTMLKWGTDWLIKAHPEPSVLFVQVGDAVLDNNYWGPDTTIPLPRPSYQINATAFGTDAAAAASTAFAAASLFFRSTGDSDDQAYSNTLLQHATQLYNASISIQPFKQYQESVPAVSDVYRSSDYRDDLIFASLWMYRATNNNDYFHNAELYYQSFMSMGHTLPTDWDDKYGAMYILFAELTLNHGDTQQATARRQEAERYLDGIESLKTANMTQGGMLWWDSVSNINSLVCALSTSNLMFLYSKTVLRPLAASTSNEVHITKALRYEAFAQRQLDYAFGKNPSQQNFIVGERPNSPKNPHHAGASGTVGFLHINSTTPSAHILYGALVGGPDRNDSYTDNRTDWRHSEVALDYNAPYQNILAHQAMYSPVNPFYMPNDGRFNDTDVNPDGTPSLFPKSTSMPAWSLVLSVVLPVGGAFLLAFFLWRRHKVGSSDTVHSEEEDDEKRASVNSNTPILERPAASYTQGEKGTTFSMFSNARS